MSLWAYSLNLADQNLPGQSTGPSIGQASNQNQDPKLPPLNLPIRQSTEPNIVPPPPISAMPPVSVTPLKPPQFSPSQASGPQSAFSSVAPMPPKPVSPPSPLPSQNLPPKPTMPSPLSSPSPVPPKPATINPLSGGSSPTPPPLSQQQNQPNQGLKSSIRTMEEDIAALKKGQAPVGFNVQKEPSQPQPIKPVSAIPPPSKPDLPKPAGGFGGPSSAFSPATPPKPASPSPLPSTHLSPSGLPQTSPAAGKTAPNAPINIPPPATRSTRLLPVLVISIVLLAIVGFSIWFFVYHKPSANVTEQPSPSGTIVSTAAPVPVIETVFQEVKSVTIDVNENIFPRFKELVGPDIKTGGEPGLYKIFQPQKANGEKYSFSEFSSASFIKTPPDVLSSVDDRGFYITLMPKSDGSIGYGFIVKVIDAVKLKAGLLNWESVMASDLTKLFALDPKKAASTSFLDNVYQNTPVRYRNFSDPAITVDYSVTSAPNGDNYLVFTNSREHIYSIINKIQAIPSSSK